MLIRDIFIKDIFRPINGVVKADQKDDAIIWQELNEYVVTRELDRLFRRFFSVYLDAVDNSHDPVLTSRTGVWVSGFFGSGKSHFIKILSYLLGNHEAHDPISKQTQKAVNFFEEKISDPMFFADIKRAGQLNTDVVLFNIDSRADASEGRAAILSVFWKVFNEMQGLCSEYPQLADIERYLIKNNKYDSFRETFKELYGSEWEKERDAYTLLKDEILEALSRVLGRNKNDVEGWFEQKEEQFKLTVEGFARGVKDYLDSKGPQKRIVFLIDEMGQFIGNDTHLMLNLQTIVEDLGRICHGRAWVIVTSQEDIDSVLGEIRSKANDFSKIQGRFHTRLSLSSSNVDEVIQKRLLEKS